MNSPIPRDLPLPLPAPQGLLEVLLVAAFIAHIVFVNLMVGGSLLVFTFQLRGLKEPDYDALARKLAMTVTVNKSLAVVLGVAPLLLINVLYTMHFYTANALTGLAWILLVPLITTTFLLLYLHKFTWDRLAGQRALHIAILGLAVALFLFIPLVFLANVNLMLFPERWTGVHGFLSALTLPNVFPRYFHFVCASLILTSLFGVWYFGRAAFPVEETFTHLTRPRLRRTFYGVAFVVSLAQFVVGPLVLVTMPAKGLDGSVIGTILVGATLAVPAVWWMWKEPSGAETDGRRLSRIAGLLALTVVCMASGRHLYRNRALAEHRAAMKAATEQWVADSMQAANARRDESASETPTAVDTGEAAFKANCAACHGVDVRIVGPPLTEIATIYSGNPDGIVSWARAPGKKRADSPPMPPFAALGDEKLSDIARYMLRAGGEPRAN
ncbi:MAG: c-type cytochrome [Archangium sp.]